MTAPTVGVRCESRYPLGTFRPWLRQRFGVGTLRYLASQARRARSLTGDEVEAIVL
jgi:hypothetical protein